jgi:hypothetical protein
MKWRRELAYEQQDKIRQWGLQVSFVQYTIVREVEQADD